jgi:hypothetical protein
MNLGGVCWAEILVLVAWMWATFLLFRVSAFRIDRARRGGYFGVPYLWNLKYFSRANFVPEGYGVLKRFWIASGAFFLAAIVAIALCY